MWYRTTTSTVHTSRRPEISSKQCHKLPRQTVYYKQKNKKQLVVVVLVGFLWQQSLCDGWLDIVVIQATATILASRTTSYQQHNVLQQKQTKIRQCVTGSNRNLQLVNSEKGTQRIVLQRAGPASQQQRTRLLRAKYDRCNRTNS